MSTRKTYWQKHTLEVVFIVAIVILLAFISDRFYSRADLTEDKAYTLTPATKKILHNIKGIVNAKFYLSRDLSPEVMPAAEQIKDVLSEYEAYGGGSFRVQIVDPTNNPEVKERAQEIGIPEVQVQVMQRDQLAVKKVFLGIALTYKDKSEIIPVVSNPKDLEYELTSRILKLTREKTPVLGVIDFSRNYDFNNPQGGQQSRFNGLKQALSERFDVKDVKLEEELEIPGDVQAVILLQPLGLSEQAKYVLDQFLLRGGNIFAPTDALMISQQQMQGYPALPGYETTFKNYGLELKKMLVLDKSSEMAQFSGGAMVIQMQYPEWIKIVPPAGFNPDFGPAAPLAKLVLPWSGYLSASDQLKDGLKSMAVITTTQDAWAVNSPFDLNPQQDWRAQYANSPKKGKFVLGYVLSGTFPSAYSGPPVPKAEEKMPPERLALISAKLDPAKYIAKSEKPGNLLVVSNGTFLEDNFIRQFPDNLMFAQNVADWMLSSGELIGIRSRTTEARPFKKELTEPVKNLIKYGITAGIPLLVILLGLLRYGLRIKRRQAIRARYTHSAPPTPPTPMAEG